MHVQRNCVIFRPACMFDESVGGIAQCVCSKESNYQYGKTYSKGNNSEQHNTTTRFRSYHLLRIRHSIVKTRQCLTIFVLTRFPPLFTFYNGDIYQDNARHYFGVFLFGCHLGPWSPTFLGCIKLITHYYCCDNGKQIRTKHDQWNYKKYKTKERVVKRWH
jgi:hypothetical protein